MESITDVPYYACGAAMGLALGYLYVWLQILQLIPGLGWAADMIRSVLPTEHTSSNNSTAVHAGSTWHGPPAATVDTVQDATVDQQPFAAVEKSAESYALMDAGALGNALYEMEQPVDESISSNFDFPQTPHPSFMDEQAPYAPTAAAAAAAAADAFRGIAALNNTTPYSDIPAAAAPDATVAAAEAAAAAAGGSDIDQQQFACLLRERLASFPLENMSPTTTATALSIYSVTAGNTARNSGDNAAFGKDDDDADFEPSPYIDLAVGPVTPVEGELDLTTGSNTQAVAEGPAAAIHDSSSTAVLPEPGDRIVPLHDISDRAVKFTPGATVKFADDATGDTAEQQQQPSMAASVLQPRQRSSADVPGAATEVLPGAVINDHTAQAAGNSSSIADDRKPVSDVSWILSPGFTAETKPPTVAGPVTATSPRSLSSIHTTDSAATVERKKQKKGLLSMLKSKAVKGRQQVR